MSGGPGGKIRVLIADDEALVRAGFRMLVDSAADLRVVGEASDGIQAVRQARALTRRPRAVPPADGALAQLTDRELEVLGQVAADLNNAEIAAGLHLSVATIKTHVSRLLSKLDSRDRAQLG